MKSIKDFLWELSHSLWILWSFFLMPCVGFFIIGRRTSYKPWIYAGVVYLVALGFIFALDDKYNENSIFQGFLVIYYFGGIIHSCLARGTYINKLREMNGMSAGSWQAQQYDYSQQTRQFSQQYQARQRQEQTRQEQPRQEQPRQEQTRTTTIVDINTCSLAQLAALPGVTVAMAKKAEQHRQLHGGFANIDEFFDTIALKPHFRVQLLDQLTCGSFQTRRPQKPADTSPKSGEATPPPTEENAHKGRQLDL